MAHPFENIRSEGGDEDRSARWYMKAVREFAANINTPNDVFNSDIGEVTSRLEIGNMYMFRYSPKTRKDLKYFDNFPLILMSEPLRDGFSGINLHYLAPLERASLLDKLLGNTRDSDINRRTRAASDWRIVKNFMRFPEVRPAIKTYLYNNVQGRVMKVHQEHWKAAIFLPVHNFTGAAPTQVWRESRKRPDNRKRRGGLTLG